MADFNCTYMLSNNKLVQLLNKKANENATCLQMKSGQGKQKITKFKYFRILLTDTSGNDTIQFTHLKFYSDSGNMFSYWNGTEQKSTIKDYVKATYSSGTAGASGGEAPEYGLLTDPQEGKCCMVGIDFSEEDPFIMQYELLEKTLDVSTYNNWCWYTANDTQSYSGRNMTKFKLQVSNTAEDDDWITIDENDDPSNIKTTANWSLAYEHKLSEIQ